MDKTLQAPFPLGFNDTIYHEGSNSEMPDFGAFSLLDVSKRYGRSSGKRKNDNLKFGHMQVYVRSSHPGGIKCFRNFP